MKKLMYLSIMLVIWGILLNVVHGAELQNAPYIVILGTAQDGGYPQAGCAANCCAAAWENPSLKRMVASIAIIDPINNERWLVDITPDFREQLHLLDQIYPYIQTSQDAQASTHRPASISGIFLTHAHIGHYTGLMYLGKEAMNARNVPVFAMQKMRDFLRNNGPWNQLVKLHNIALQPIMETVPIKINNRITITPFIVPHRGEYSETIGLLIRGPSKSFLYIPDIDTWEGMETPIEKLLSAVNYAYLDGTFYGPGELPAGRTKEVSHPLITESMARFKSLPAKERNKIRFIHFNHTNPLFNLQSDERKAVFSAGFGIAEQGEKIIL